MKTNDTRYFGSQTSFSLSQHAKKRLRQRGLADGDITLIVEYGEDVEDGFVMTNKAIKNRKEKIAREMQQLEKLRGVAVIESQGVIVTTYRADKRRIKRLRQHA